MHKFGVFTALALSWITASCAERMVHPAVISQLNPSKAASKPRPNNVEARRQAEEIAEGTRNLGSVATLSFLSRDYGLRGQERVKQDVQGQTI
jgi:hypothetical protein